MRTDGIGSTWPAAAPRLDPEGEQAFRATLAADAWVRVRVVVVLAVAVTVGYLLLAPEEDPGTFERVGPPLAIAVLLGLLAVSFVARAEGSLRWVVPLTWSVLGAFVVTSILRSSEGHGTVTFDLLVVYVLAIDFAAAVGILRSAVVAGAASLAWAALGQVVGVERPTFAYDVLLLVAANVVGAYGAWVLEAERRRAFALQRRLEAVAFTDPLTGLPERRGFDQRLVDAWAIASEENRSIAVAMLDVDRFKLVNDHGGHAAGDRALVAVAACLAADLRRPLDVVGRVGGDEFAMVWFDADDRWLAGALEDLCRSIADAGAAAGTPLTVSIGAVHVARPAGDPADALRRADAALLRVKHQGGGRSSLERFAP